MDPNFICLRRTIVALIFPARNCGDVALEATLEELSVSFKNNWNKPIHRWYRFHAGCSSEFPEKMISLLRIRKDSNILDPFSGSGTVLVCSKERGIDSIGIDVNPFYVFTSRVKTYWEFDLDELCELVSSFAVELEFSLGKSAPDSVNENSQLVIGNIPEYIWRYFKPEVLKKLSFLKERVSDIKSERVRNLLLLALASILIDVSKVHHVGETIVFNKHPIGDVQVYQKYSQKIWEVYSDLRTKQHIKNKGRVEVREDDVRNLDKLILDKSLDHVITHPPYANNYNYLLHDRLPLYFLDYLKTRSDEKKLCESIVGSVTKNKVTQNFIPITNDVKKIAQRIKETGDMERYKAVLEYFDTMNSFLETLFNKLRKNGYCAMLLGNSYVRGVMIPLDVLFAKMARKIGFEVVDISKVRDRGNGAFQHIYNGELYESVVLLKRS